MRLTRTGSGSRQWSVMAKNIETMTRTATVAVVAGFLFLASAIAVITGVSLLTPSPHWNWLWDLNRPAYMAFHKLGRLSGVLLLVVAAGAFIAANGLLRRRRWAWWMAVALFSVNGLGDLAALLLRGEVIRGGSGVLIAGAFLFCLTRPRVRRQFL
jgi:hypothetical protein